MRARLALAFALSSIAPARAQPTVTLDGCGFDAAALDRALAQEGATTATVHVACSADGLARLTIATASSRPSGPTSSASAPSTPPRPRY